jgi:hypothetical protein
MKLATIGNFLKPLLYGILLTVLGAFFAEPGYFLSEPFASIIYITPFALPVAFLFASAFTFSRWKIFLLQVALVLVSVVAYAANVFSYGMLGSASLATLILFIYTASGIVALFLGFIGRKIHAKNPKIARICAVLLPVSILILSYVVWYW